MPGSGKSYVVTRTTKMFGMRVVNSDDVFEQLIKKAGMPYWIWKLCKRKQEMNRIVQTNNKSKNG